MFEGKKILVLGGKPIGSVELVERAKQLGAYVVVADYLPKEESPAKRIADESCDKYIRIAFTLEEDKIKEGVRRIGEFIKSLEK